jgi:hypothetical protein
MKIEMEVEMEEEIDEFMMRAKLMLVVLFVICLYITESASTLINVIHIHPHHLVLFVYHQPILPLSQLPVHSECAIQTPHIAFVCTARTVISTIRSHQRHILLQQCIVRAPKHSGLLFLAFLPKKSR